jgi:hypothetical protein
MKKITFSVLAVLFCVGINAQVNLTNGLVGCYPFSGDANDYSGNHHHGLVSGATLTTDRFGQANSAYLFNGTSDYIAVQHFDSLITQDEISISIWSMANQNTSNVGVLLYPDDNTDRLVCGMNYTGVGSIWDYGDFTGGGTQLATDNYSTNWEHYVFITSLSGNIKTIYQNGSVVATSAFAKSLVNRARTLYFGGGVDASGGGIRFHGALDDIRIYNRALNNSEVTALYTATMITNCSVITATGISSWSEAGINIITENNGDISLQLGSSPVKGKLMIYNSTGQLVSEKAMNSQAFEREQVLVNELPSGIYILTLLSENQRYTWKFRH